MSQSVMVIAGEISGDMHAARLIRAVRARAPEVEFFGIGGPEMRAAGAQTFHDVREMAVLGLSEVLRRYRFFRGVFMEMAALARRRRPDLVLLVDYPGFNLRFAAVARQLGLKVVYYICPQVWAWRRSRIPKMARLVHRLLVIFPFETEVFRGTGLRVDFVGHPLVEAARQAWSAPPETLPWGDGPRVALLPGSRRQEVERILPAMRDAAECLRARAPGASFLIAMPSAEMADFARGALVRAGADPARYEIVAGRTREVLRQARAAMVASGTATIEAALMGCPMIVVYKTAWLTYGAGRLLIRVPFLGMVNIVAGRRLCPEFIQHEAAPRPMAEALAPLLDDTPERAAMVEGLKSVGAALGREQGSDLAAAILLEELSRPS